MNATCVPSGEGVPLLASSRNLVGGAPVVETDHKLDRFVTPENPLAISLELSRNQDNWSATKSPTPGKGLVSPLSFDFRKSPSILAYAVNLPSGEMAAAVARFSGTSVVT